MDAAAASGVAAGVVIMAADSGCGPREVRVAGPGVLTMTFHNHGQGDRTLTIEGLPGALTAQGGGEAIGTFTLPRPGTYTFWCATAAQRQPGALEKWWQGTLVVGNGLAGQP